MKTKPDDRKTENANPIKALSLIKVRFEGKATGKFDKAIKRHIETHREVTLVDLVKFVYQSVLGSHHLLDRMSNREIKQWVEKELASANPDKNLSEDLYGSKWIRLNLEAFKQKFGNNSELLAKLFIEGRKERKGSVDSFAAKLDALLKLVTSEKIKPVSPFSDFAGLALNFQTVFKQMGFPPLHHSDVYSKKNPRYLVVPRKSLHRLISCKNSGKHEGRLRKTKQR
ncbi:MAG: hypothetical protein QXJ02_00595 [Candidatus Bathyarchaeia archaeon]